MKYGARRTACGSCARIIRYVGFFVVRQFPAGWSLKMGATSSFFLDDAFDFQRLDPFRRAHSQLGA
jgi:hypothetical protein